jgi:hypothetical protein
MKGVFTEDVTIDLKKKDKDETHPPRTGYT